MAMAGDEWKARVGHIGVFLHAYRYYYPEIITSNETKI